MLLLVAVVGFKAIFADIVLVDPLFGVYGLVVCAYIVSRFVFSTLYRPSADHGLRPRVAIVMPAFNEEEAIAASLTSLLDLDYAPELLEIVAVERRLDRRHAPADARGRRRRRRAACASSTSAATAASAPRWRPASARRTPQIIAFVDSDSVLEPDAMTKLVQGFHDPRGRARSAGTPTC